MVGRLGVVEEVAGDDEAGARADEALPGAADAGGGLWNDISASYSSFVYRGNSISTTIDLSACSFARSCSHHFSQPSPPSSRSGSLGFFF